MAHYLCEQAAARNAAGDPERISPQSSSVPIAAGATTLAATLPPLSFAVMVVPLA
jgi:hypothetical protein